MPGVSGPRKGFGPAAAELARQPPELVQEANVVPAPTDTSAPLGRRGAAAAGDRRWGPLAPRLVPSFATVSEVASGPVLPLS